MAQVAEQAKYLSESGSTVVVNTSANVESAVLAAWKTEEPGWATWQRFIDKQLREWLRDPDQLADEGIDPPRREIIRNALALAHYFRDCGEPPPDTIVPDPNGGVVFEWCEGAVAKAIHLWDDGNIEYFRFMGADLVERRTFF